MPTHFYKTLVYEGTNNYLQTLTILLPHKDESVAHLETKGYFEEHIRDIADIEIVTGYDFFEGLEDYKESAVEEYTTPVLWPVSSR